MERRTTKRAAAAVAFAATLTGGALVGAMLGAPTTSGAQSSDSTTTTTAPETERTRPDGPGEGGFRFGFEVFDLSAAADVLGLTEDELRDRLDGGETLSEIAEAEGVAVDEVIDALVAAGREAIDEAAADAKENLEERITSLVEDGFPEREGFPGMDGPGHHIFGFADPSVAAEALGITEDELRDRLRDGDSLAEIAEAEGVDVDQVVDALVAAATSAIDEKVAAGDLDEDRVADLKADLEERIRSFVEDGWPGPWGHRPR